MIEVDGDSHFDAESKLEDFERQRILKNMGLSFLRILDAEVKNSMPLVSQEIGVFIDDWELMNRVDKTSFS